MPSRLPAGSGAQASSGVVGRPGPREGERAARGRRCAQARPVEDPPVVGRDGEGEAVVHEVVDRGGRDDVPADAGRADRVQAVEVVVARGGDYDDAVTDQARGGLRDRPLRPAVAVLADAHVEHVGAVAIHALHRGEHHVGGRRPAAAEHAVRAEGDVGSHAAHRPVGAEDAGDVRTVALAVVRERVGMRHRLPLRVALLLVVVVADEVVAVGDAATRPEAAAQVWVVIVDPGVDDRHVDASAGVAEPALRDVGARHGERETEVGCERLGAHVERDRLYGVNGLDGVEITDLGGRGLARGH